jgi:beta-lactamase regulating signal transducer with metallopeptidase domain
MDVLNQSAFLKALGWSLLDSFWQMGVLWLLYVLLTGNGKRLQSPQRHSLALLSLAGGSIWFLITLILHFNDVVNSTVVYVPFGNDSVNRETSLTSFFKFVEPILPSLSLLYLAAIIYLFIRLYRQYHITQKLFFTGTHKVSPELRVFLHRIVAQMGIKKNVRIWLSDLVDTPLTIGFWKPVILLPVAVINHLTLQQAEAIVLHELNHIRRNDYLINLLIACMDIILFFNPFVRILTHIIKNERENSCDDMVLQFRYDPKQYANALLLLEKNRMCTSEVTIAATGRSKKLLLNRVERILNKKPSNTPVNHKLIACFVSALLFGFIGMYNPGKSIAKTIDTLENFTVNIKDEQAYFSSTELNDQDFATQNKITIKKINPANTRVLKNNDVQKKLDQVLEYISEKTASEISDQLLLSATSYYDAAFPVATYIAAQPEIREYSIPETISTTTPDYSVDVHPFIPSTSFSYHIVEDTALPKKYILTQAEVNAREAKSSALKALYEIDWLKIEKELNSSGKKIDIIKLQQELKKAMEDLDWKKINEEVQSHLVVEENELMEKQSLLQAELLKFYQQRKAQLEDKERLQKAIIHDRLCDEKDQIEKPVKKKQVQKKKIVYI